MKFKKIICYACYAMVMIVTMFGIVTTNIKAEKSIEDFFQERLDELFETNENGDYVYTYQILDSSKIGGMLGSNYDNKIDELATNGSLSAILLNNRKVQRFDLPYESSAVLHYNGAVYGHLVMENCTSDEDYSDKKVYKCMVSYSYTVYEGTNEFSEDDERLICDYHTMDGPICSLEDYCPNEYSYCLVKNNSTEKKNLIINFIKNEPNQNIVSQINKYYEKYPEIRDLKIRDLSYINFARSLDFTECDFIVLNHSLYYKSVCDYDNDIYKDSSKFENLASFTDLYSFFPNGNVKIRSYQNESNSDVSYPQVEKTIYGFLTYMYNDILYAISYPTNDIKLNIQHVFYVPIGTLKEDYEKVVEKRISDYLNDGFDTFLIDIEDTHTDAAISTRFHIDETSGKSLYKLTISNSTKTYNSYILINEGNEEDLKLPEVNFKDYKNNVIMKSNSSDVPLDSILEVEKIESGERYNNIKSIFGDKSFTAYNLALVSSLRGEVTSIKSGEIHIYFPLPSGYNEKTSSIYYISNSNIISKHEIVEYITIDGIKYAHFTTNHFSDYAIVDENLDTINNPKTGEISNIFFIGILVISLFGLLIYKRKKIFNIV